MPKSRPIIPNKLYFRIGEAAEIVGVEAYVLRFWESEFPSLKPSKSPAGQRLYRKPEIEKLLRLKHLLYEEGHTIEGARKALRSHDRRQGAQTPLPFDPPGSGAALKKVRQELNGLLEMLQKRKIEAAKK